MQGEGYGYGPPEEEKTGVEAIPLCKDSEATLPLESQHDPPPPDVLKSTFPERGVPSANFMVAVMVANEPNV
jgi:hypothetical protein